jgi:hypothetical protein
VAGHAAAGWEVGRSRSQRTKELEVEMSRFMVVYESMFGNTRLVAESVADGLRAGTGADVTLVEVGGAPTVLPALDLLVVGGPTHAFGLSRPSTREDAACKSDRAVESRTGLREWLQALDPAGAVPQTAAFDTRVDHPRVPGSAAKKAAKRLRRLGLRPAAPTESFWVHGTEGPLLDGEVERARAWGRKLAEAPVPDGASPSAR